MKVYYMWSTLRENEPSEFFPNINMSKLFQFVLNETDMELYKWGSCMYSEQLEYCKWDKWLDFCKLTVQMLQPVC